MIRADSRLDCRTVAPCTRPDPPPRRHPSAAAAPDAMPMPASVSARVAPADPLAYAGHRIDPGASARARRHDQSRRALSRASSGSARMMAGARSANCRRSGPRSRSRSRARSSRRTIRPISPSTARSTPIAAASMAASTASRGRATPISACRRGSISRRKLTAKPDAALLLEKELSAASYQPRTIAIGTNTDAYQPIEKKLRIMRRSWRCWSASTIRSASSPNRRWCSATSTSSRRWRPRGWPRSRSR